MNNLEQYLKYDCINMIINFENLDYEHFGYKNIDEIQLDLEFLIDTLYPNYTINYQPVTHMQETRPDQDPFRQKLIQKYGMCIVTGTKCLGELQACHIVPHVEDKHNSLVTNGLLLKANIHGTFDMHDWTINPNTLMIELKNATEEDAGEMLKYQGVKVNLDPNDKILINNLRKRYQSFLDSKN
jgi:hypothetical protein